jgi:hypothetical protein
MQHGWPLTRVLLLPTLYILIGLYSCLILCHGFINTVTDHYMALAQQHLLLFLAIVAVLALGTLSLFFKGFWQYAVYWTSLNLNAQEALTGQPLDIPAAYRLIAQEKRVAYKLLLVAYGALAGLAVTVFVACALLATLLTLLQNPVAAGGLLLIGLVVSTLLLGLWVILTIPMSLAFQVMVFQPTAQPNPLPILLESGRMVMKRFWATLGLQLILLIATNYLLTLPIAFVARVSRLVMPLDALHQWLIGMLLSSAASDPGSDPTVRQLISTMQGMAPELAHGWTDATVMLAVTALLLPLGTFAFTLLYRDIRRTDGLE